MGDEAVLVHNYRTEEPIGAMGNASGPKGARPSDFEVNSGSDLIPTNTEFGKSTFNSKENAKKASLTGAYWELPVGTELPDCFGIYPDGADVGGKMSYGHRSIFATISMTLDQFNVLFKLLSWEEAGKIKKK